MPSPSEPQVEPSDAMMLRNGAATFGWTGELNDYSAIRDWLLRGVGRLYAAMSSLDDDSDFNPGEYTAPVEGNEQ